MQDPYGYLVSYGYRGWVESYHRWIIFATENEYLEFISGE